ncbi:MAG: multiheme c-type cytochrome [Myxococcota bacterium]
MTITSSVAGRTALLLLLQGIGCTSRAPSSASLDESEPFDPKAIAERLATQTKQPIDINDPSTCATCHGVVYAEWTESMHSKAHHAHDPIYAAMRDFRLSKGHEIQGKCENCHAPRANGRTDSAAALAGVSCSACHNIEAVHEADESEGAKLIVAAKDDVMRSARDIENGRSPVHGNGPALPAMADGKTLCLACHGNHSNPAGLSVCTTGSELDAHVGKETCVSCHMPEVPGPSGAVNSSKTHRSHQFVGPHRAYLQDDPSILASGARLQVELEPGRVRLRLENRSGHSFPSGFPGRVVTLRVQGFDADGQEVWSNAGAPDTVLRRAFLDAEGKPTMPPFAKQVGPDTRLKPDEVRSMEFEVPKKVVAVRAALQYRLLPDTAAKIMGLSGPLARPISVISEKAEL